MGETISAIIGLGLGAFFWIWLIFGFISDDKEEKRKVAEDVFEHYSCSHERCCMCGKEILNSTMYKVPYKRLLNDDGSCNWRKSYYYWDIIRSRNEQRINNGFVNTNPVYIDRTDSPYAKYLYDNELDMLRKGVPCRLSYFERTYRMWRWLQLNDMKKGGDGTASICERCTYWLYDDEYNVFEWVFFGKRKCMEKKERMKHWY